MTSAIDPWASGRPRDASAPRDHVIDIDNDGASNTNELPYVIDALLIGTDGAIKVTTAGGETETFPTGTFAVGVWHSGLRIKKVFVTGTTATNVWGAR